MMFIVLCKVKKLNRLITMRIEITNNLNRTVKINSREVKPGQQFGLTVEDIVIDGVNFTKPYMDDIKKYFSLSVTNILNNQSDGKCMCSIHKILTSGCDCGGK